MHSYIFTNIYSVMRFFTPVLILISYCIQNSKIRWGIKIDHINTTENFIFCICSKVFSCLNCLRICTIFLIQKLFDTPDSYTLCVHIGYSFWRNFTPLSPFLHCSETLVSCDNTPKDNQLESGLWGTRWLYWICNNQVVQNLKYEFANFWQ